VQSNRLNIREAAPGVHRLGTKWANFYLVVEDGEAVLVDAGYPSYWKQLAAVEGLGKALDMIAAVIITHHHVDHTGAAEAVRSRCGAEVLVHPEDAPMVRGDRRSHVPPGFYRQSWRPSMARYLTHTVAAGGAQYRAVASVRPTPGDAVLDLPGRPRVIHTPGHTAGHCSVFLEERGVLFTGDAMVNFDYATGEHGLKQHRFNDDRELALASLDRLEPVDAAVLLFGHGDPWTQGLSSALEIVRAKAQ
jgi:glyoxylase-like metal-dependent hydrolase (beta-lactamase superfamily II)